jgi:hypothetical protein
MNLNLAKIAVPALIVLAGAGTVVTGWVNQIIQLSWRTDGTMFDEYATKYPAINNPAPSDAAFCDPAYKTRWAGCTLNKK